MFENFKARYGRLVAGAKSRFASWFRRKTPISRGTWLSGKHRESSGFLVFAPLILPKRGYRLYLPSGYRKDERLPLIVMLHGCKQTPEAFAAGTRINLLAERARFIVLYPEQARLANPYRCWNWFDPSNHNGNGEVAIIAGMVREVAKQHNAPIAPLRRRPLRRRRPRERAGKLPRGFVCGLCRPLRLDVSSGEFRRRRAAGHAKRIAARPGKGRRERL